MAYIEVIAETAVSGAATRLGMNFLSASRVAVRSAQSSLPEHTLTVCGSLAANNTSVLFDHGRLWLASDVDLLCDGSYGDQQIENAARTADVLLDRTCAARLPSSRVSLKPHRKGMPLPIEHRISIYSAAHSSGDEQSPWVLRPPALQGAQLLTQPLIHAWGIAKFAMLMNKGRAARLDALYHFAKGLRQPTDVMRTFPSPTVLVYDVWNLRAFVMDHARAALQGLFPGNTNVQAEIIDAAAAIPHDGQCGVALPRESRTYRWLCLLQRYVQDQLPATRLASLLGQKVNQWEQC